MYYKALNQLRQALPVLKSNQRHFQSVQRYLTDAYLIPKNMKVVKICYYNVGKGVHVQILLAVLFHISCF